MLTPFTFTLKIGDYVELFDHRVRGPLVEAQNANGDIVFAIENCLDEDLKLGWWPRGTYAERDNRISGDRPRDVLRRLALHEVAALVGSLIPTQPRSAARAVVQPGETEPLMLTKQQRDRLLALISDERIADEAADQASPIFVRTSFQVKPIYEEWVARRKLDRNEAKEYLLDVFTAGYNAAVRNEIGPGFRDSEKAEGGQSESDPEKLPPAPVPNPIDLAREIHAVLVNQEVAGDFDSRSPEIRQKFVNTAAHLIERYLNPKAAGKDHA